MAGYLVFAMVYAGMSLNTSTSLFILLFFLYGLYAASTEGIAKAWITNIVGKHDKATAIGTFTSFQSICTMLASSLTGFIWYKFGSFAAFMTTAIATICIVIYFLAVKPDKNNFITAKSN